MTNDATLHAVYERFGSETQLVLVAAEQEAFRAGAGQVEPEHLLIELAASATPAGAALRSLGVNPDRARWALAGESAVIDLRERPLTLSAASTVACSLAAREADEHHSVTVHSEHLLLGLLREPFGRSAQFLARSGHDAATLAAQVRDHLTKRTLSTPVIPLGESGLSSRPATGSTLPPPPRESTSVGVPAVAADLASEVVQTVQPFDGELLHSLVAELTALRLEIAALRSEVSRLRSSRRD